jgi:hypothetical protein
VLLDALERLPRGPRIDQEGDSQILRDNKVAWRGRLVVDVWVTIIVAIAEQELISIRYNAIELVRPEDQSHGTFASAV